MPQNAVVYLDHEIEAFNISDDQFQSLKTRFPELLFKRVHSEEELISILAQAHIYFGLHMREHWYDHAPNLRIIATPAAGHDWIEPDPRRRVAVLHGSYHGSIMAESLLAMMFYFSRKMACLIDNQRAHRWERNFLSNTRIIGGSTVMIVGYGHIGRHCAKLLSAMECKIVAVKRSRRDPKLDRDADIVVTFNQCSEFLPKCDHVVAILPSSPQTDCLLDRRFFQSMRSDAYFYNLGRANCYPESLLTEILEKKVIAGAALDVFDREPLAPDSPLWDIENVLIMPHAPALSSEYLWMWLDELEEKLNLD